jgi:hypothetical protein
MSNLPFCWRCCERYCREADALRSVAEALTIRYPWPARCAGPRTAGITNCDRTVSRASWVRELGRQHDHPIQPVTTKTYCPP